MKINSKNFASKCLIGCTLISMTLTSVGCETMVTDAAGNKRKKKEASWFSFKKKEYQIPQSVTATWTHDILTLPGKPPTRGFGGRFYFYNEKTQAIPVDGDLVVYGFDDTNKQQVSEDLSQCTKKFRFTAEQLTTHFSEGELGASYSVWIPWDEAYGAPKKIMLIPTFLTKEGRTIRGAAASLNLPGTAQESQVQQASFVPNTWTNPADSTRMENGASAPSGLRTTTIQVPSNSLMRHAPSMETSPNLTDFQSQQMAVASSILANSMGQNGQAYAYSPSTNQTGFDPNAQLGQPNMANGQPAPAQMQQVAVPKNPSGWVSPEFAQLNWSGPSARSSLLQPPAQASKGVQPSSYQPR